MTDEQPKPDKTFRGCLVKETKSIYTKAVKMVLFFILGFIIIGVVITALNFVLVSIAEKGSEFRDATNAATYSGVAAICSVIPPIAIAGLAILALPAAYALAKCLCRWKKGFGVQATLFMFTAGIIVCVFAALLLNSLVFGIGCLILLSAIPFAYIEDELNRENGGVQDGRD